MPSVLALHKGLPVRSRKAYTLPSGDASVATNSRSSSSSGPPWIVPPSRERHGTPPPSRLTTRTVRPTVPTASTAAPRAGAPGAARPAVVAHRGRGREVAGGVAGRGRAGARGPGGGGVELRVTDRRTRGASPDFPITPKEHGAAFLFERRHLWLRSRRQVAIARVRHEVVQAIRDFFYQRGFVLVDTPILTGSIGEHAGTLFATDYFDLGKA